MEILVAFLGSVFYLGFIVFAILAYWKTFTKANQPGWACLIPIYNYLVMADIAKVSRTQVWKAMATGFIGYVLYFIMIFANQGDSEMILIAGIIILVTVILTLYFMFPVYKGIALNFGQPAAFAWGLIFLNFIFFAILAFGNSKYMDDQSTGDDSLLDADI